MNQLDEQIYRKCIFAILNAEKDVIGTGFFISAEGYALSCYHVVEDLEVISVADYADQRYTATLDKTLSSPECDLALLKIDIATSNYLTPLLSFSLGDEVWASGYQFYGKNIRQPLPTLGRIEGTTAVTFGRSQTYSLENILKIGNATMEEGISGGPVMLLKEKKVIGIANAKFSAGGGFSMPFVEAITHSAAFKDFLEELIEQDKEDQRRQKDQLFDAVLKVQVRNALNRLIETEQFLKGSVQPRKDATKNILEFLGSSSKIFPLIGMSGVGKTSLLASLADEGLQNNAVLFLSAYQFSFANNGLKGDVENELAYLLEQQQETRISIQDLMLAFQSAAYPVTIIVEGFNEVLATPNNIKLWIHRTVDWIKACNIQMIISSRPEFWQLYEKVFPSSLFFGKDKDEKYSSTKLNDFTKEELSGALKLYKLPDTLIANTKLGHPLLLRIIWLLQNHTQSKTEATSSIVLFSAFVKHKCSTIGERESISEDQVYNGFLIVAQKLLDTKSFALPLTIYFSILSPRLADALLYENICTRSETLIRFAFDQLAEYLVSEIVHSNIEQDWDNMFREADYFDSKILPWVLARKEHNEAEINTVLKILCDLIEGGNEQLLGLFNTFMLICEKPGKYLPVITRLYESDKIDRESTRVKYYLAELINNIGLPIEEKLKLVRIYFLYQNYYPWREKDWNKKSFDEFLTENFNDPYEILPFFKITLLNEPEKVFPALRTWLDDYSKLDKVEASICDVAGAIFYHFSTLNFGLISNILSTEATGGSQQAGHILLMIANKNPNKMTSVVATWHRTSLHRKITLDICRLILNLPGQDYYQSLFPIISTFSEEQETEMLYKWATTLLKYEEHTSEMIAIILSLSKSDPNYLNSLHNLLDTHFDIIFPAIDALIISVYRVDSVDVYLNVLFGGKYTDEHTVVLADNLEKYLNSLKSYDRLHYPLAFALELFSYNVEYETDAYPKLLSLIKRFILELSAKQLGPVLYIITNLKSEEKRSDFLSLIEWSIDQPSFRAMHHELTEIFVRNSLMQVETETAFRIIKKILLADTLQEIIASILFGLGRLSNVKAFEVLKMLATDTDLNHIEKLNRVNTLIKTGQFKSMENIRNSLDKIIFSE